VSSAVIRIQSLGDQWEQIGTGSWSGFWPEAITATSNKWGPDTLTFTLRRDPRVGGAFNLNAFAPIELEVDGAVVWDGYVWETPTTISASSVSVAVTARGKQYSLDDESYARTYVQTDLGVWSDVRGQPTANLAKWPQALTASAGDGAITLGAANGSAWTTLTAAGVVADFGPDPSSWIESVAIEVGRGPGTMSTGGDIYVRNADDPANLLSGVAGTYEDFISGYAASSVTPQTTGFDTLTGTVTTKRRYVAVFVFNGGITYTATTDDVIMIKAVRCYSDDAFSSAGDSVLHADDVVKDALSHQPYLTQDVSDIAATAFEIPDFVIGEPRTVREIIEAANAFHAYRTKVKVGGALKFAPQPTTPTLETGDEPGSEFSDASANVAEEMFNRVDVTGTGPDGNSLLVRRTTQQSALSTQLVARSSPSFQNGLFASNISGWTGAGGGAGWAWDSAVSHSVPGGSLRATTNTADFVYTQFTSGMTFEKDHTYVFRYWARQDDMTISSHAGQPHIMIDDPAAATARYSDGETYYNGQLLAPAWTPLNITAGIASNDIQVVNRWEQFEVQWTPLETYTGDRVYFRFEQATSTTTGKHRWYDDFVIYCAVPTLLDRVGRNRTATLTVSSPLTVNAAKQLGDVFLALRSRTPFKGSWSVTGRGVRSALTGAPISPAEVLLYSGELVRFSNLVDPDVGGVGRDGIIDTVSYSHDERTASVSIDNTRNDFESLLARLAAVTQARSRY
jgi:hypothetical protein